MNKLLKKVLNKSISIFLIFFIVVAGGIIGAAIYNHYDFLNMNEFSGDVGIKNIEQTNLTSIIDECKVLKRIDMKLNCVKNHTKRFYHYIKRKDREDVSFKVLIEEGGDCRNWAQYWEYVASEMGLKHENLRIGVDLITAHRFGVFYNQQGYCLVDQLRIECIIYS